VSSEQQIRLTITGDSKQAVAAANETKAALRGVGDSASASAAGTTKAKASVDALGSSFKAFTAQRGAVDAMMASQAKSLADVAARQTAYSKALKAGVLDQAEYTTASKALEGQARKLFDAFAKSAPAIGDVAKATHTLELGSRAAQRELGVLVGELARGNTAAFERSLITLGRQIGLLNLLFSATGLAVAGVGAAIGLLIAAEAAAEERTNAFNRALLVTGGYAQLSAAQLSQQAGVIGAATGAYGDAQEALTLLAATGKLTGTNLENAAQGAVSFAQLTGQSVDKAAEAFVKLHDDPLAAAEKLNDSYHFLTQAVYEEIRALEEGGNKAEAARVATDAFADSMIDRAAQYRETLTGVAALWDDVSRAIGGATHQVEDFINKRVEAARQQGAGALVAGILGGAGAAGGIFGAAPAAPISAGVQAGVGVFDQNTEEAIKAEAAIRKETEALKAHADTIGKTTVQIVEMNRAKALATAQSDQARAAINAEYDSQLQYARAIDATKAAMKDHTNVAAIENRTLSELDAQINAGVRTAEQLADVYGTPLQRATTQYENTLKTLGIAMDALEAKNAVTKGGLPGFAELWQQLSDAAADAGDQFDDTSDQIEKDSHIVDNMLARMSAENSARAKSSAQLAAERAEYDALTKAKTQKIKIDDAEIARLKQGAALQATIGEAIQVANQFEDPFEKLNKQLADFKDVLAEISDPMSKAFDPKQIEPLTKAIEATRQKMVVGFVQTTQEGLRSLQSMTKDGSRAFQAMQIAIDALTVVQAISAVLNQAQGDPYTAFARMAAMAAAVAALGVDIASFGGGNGQSSNSAEARQATQGTGTVLGDTKKQSESIENAVKITADASQQLVGLNRGMLDALHNLEDALGAAGNQLARGAADAQFSGPHDAFNVLDPVGKDPLGGAIGNFIFGGSQKVIDQGVIIAGGYLTDMLNQIVVGAYQTIHTSGGLFGGGGDSDQVVDVSDSFGKQFQLVIGSIVTTVREAALALGLLPADIDKAIDEFKIAETRISLEGLSAEDQQKALEAVFSQIFDGLAGAVVPFIGEFQQVGEGLGETLVRVATEVQVTQNAFHQLGIAVDESDPQKFAEIADGLVQAAGGLDAFIQGMQSFIQKFAPQGEQVKVQGEALSSALGQVGLALPTTRDGMWALMQSLDATTEEGRKQIAVLLQLADASDAYYTALEQQVQKMGDYADFLGQLADEAGSVAEISGFTIARLKIQAWEQETIEQANRLAQAAGLQGASESTLSLIHQIAARRIAAAVVQIKQEIADLANELGYLGVTVDGVNASTDDLGDRMTNQFQRIGDAADDLYQRQLDGIKSIQDYLVQLQFGDLSGLSPEEQLAAARQQLVQLQQAALGGDADALQQLPQMADAFLQLLRNQEASGGDYNAGYNFVRQLLQSVVDLGPTATPPNPNAGGIVGGGGLTRQDLDDHDARLINSEEGYRQGLALQLAQHLADLSQALNVPVLELAEQMHIPLQQLAEDLGVDLQNITGASVEALANMAQQLGIPLGELVEGLGLQLPDLADGIRELATGLGIDLTNLTGETAGQLADLAASLGTNLHTLAESLGIDLGKLTDVNSPIFVALQTKVGDIGGDTSTELQPYLDAIKNATSEEDKNLAVKALRDHVDTLAPDIKNQLAPFFDDIVPADPNDQLLYLSNMADSTGSMATDLDAARTLLGDIKEAIKDTAHHDGVPGYAIGSAYIDRDHLAMVHEGEGIVDRASWAVLQKYGIRVATAASNDDTRAMVVELRALRDDVGKLQATALQADRNNTSRQEAEGRQTRITLDGLRRDTPLARRAVG
jgi:hypothetical protein